MDDYKHALKNETASAPGVTRQQLTKWIAAADQFAATGDANFADDGEIAVSPALNVGKPLKPAAVLILLVNQRTGEGVEGGEGIAAEPRVLFTQRTAHLTDHGGQISFPGGRVAPNDTDLAATATRETFEEIGVRPADV